MAREDLQKELSELWHRRIAVEEEVLKNYKASGRKSFAEEAAKREVELEAIKARIKEIAKKLKEES